MSRGALIAGAMVGASLSLASAGEAGADGAADAEGVTEGALAVLRSPTVTVGAGVVVPLVRLYAAGPWAEVSLGWDLNARVKVVATASVGALFADGARRYLGSLGAGVRVAPWRRGPWLQLGLGTTVHVERIGVALPDKMVSATDLGADVTADVGIGVRVQRWEIAVAWNHILRASPYYQLYDGDEELPFWGTGLAWVGRQL